MLKNNYYMYCRYFSYKSKPHSDAYHPIFNNQSKSDFYLLKSDEFQFIKHDSVIKLNDLRSVSINRILYKHEGRFDIEGKDFVRIKHMTIQKHFASFYKEHEDLLKEKELYEEEIAKLKAKIMELEEKQNHYEFEEFITV